MIEKINILIKNLYSDIESLIKILIKDINAIYIDIFAITYGFTNNEDKENDEIEYICNLIKEDKRSKK